MLLLQNKWIALIDSDNFANDQYFITAKNYIDNNIKNDKNIILAPSFAKPNFNYIYNNKNDKDKKRVADAFDIIKIMLDNKEKYLEKISITDEILISTAEEFKQQQRLKIQRQLPSQKRKAVNDNVEINSSAMRKKQRFQSKLEELEHAEDIKKIVVYNLQHKVGVLQLKIRRIETQMREIANEKLEVLRHIAIAKKELKK